MPVAGVVGPAATSPAPPVASPLGGAVVAVGAVVVVAAGTVVVGAEVAGAVVAGAVVGADVVGAAARLGASSPDRITAAAIPAPSTTAITAANPSWTRRFIPCRAPC